jgi:hypothetical protein
MIGLLKQFCDLKFQLRFAYLVGIFSHLNKLNLQPQGSCNTERGGCENRLCAYVCKLLCGWEKLKQQIIWRFRRSKLLLTTKITLYHHQVQQIVLHHLQELEKNFYKALLECNNAGKEAVKINLKLIQCQRRRAI